MKIHEVYRHPEADMAAIEKFCGDAQILLNKLEEAQAAGVTMHGDYAKVALELANVSRLSIKENQPVGAMELFGFQITDRKHGEVLLYEALFLPRANSGIVRYLGRRFLDGDENSIASRIYSENPKIYSEMAQEIQRNVEWLRGSYSVSGKKPHLYISVELKEWARAHTFCWYALPNLCYDVERYISNHPAVLEDDSERAKLWKRYLGLKQRFETNTFLTEKCRDHYSLCYWGSFVTLEKLNSAPVERIAYADFSEEGMNRVEKLLTELEVIAAEQ